MYLFFNVIDARNGDECDSRHEVRGWGHSDDSTWLSGISHSILINNFICG